jgi:magnesium-transporting ATPase (P-type)
VLWINMVTAVCLGMMLAFEPKERDIMHRPPRSPDAPILSPLLLARMVLVSTLMLAGAFGLFLWELGAGASIAEARTAAVNVFVLAEMFYLYNCRSLTDSPLTQGLFTNNWVNAGVLTMIALQIAFTYEPHMQQFFHTAAIPLETWLRACGAGFAIGVVVELEKGLRRLLRRRRLARLPSAPARATA